MLMLTFMYIFGFVLIKSFPLFNSTILVGAVLGIRFIGIKKYRSITMKAVLNKKILTIFGVLIVIISYSLFITTILGEYDYSIVKTLFNQGINLLIGIFLYALFKEKENEHSIFKYIIYAFILQALIQLISFLIPQINELFNYFRPDSVIERGQWGYSGVRGLALAGSNFYGLSSAYGLMFLMYFMNWDNLFRSSRIVKWIVLLLLLFGSLSAGRTSLIGFTLGAMAALSLKTLYGLKNKSFKIRKYSLNKKSVIVGGTLALTIGLIVGLMNGRLNDNIVGKIENFKRFAFEMFYNLQEGKGFSTTSTSNMFDNMYFMVNTKTFILGDGRYTNLDGSYYMNTDVGYMRNILFFGIIGFIILLIYQALFLHWNNKNIIESLVVLFYILIIHLKGDILGFLIVTQNMLLLYYLGKRNKNIFIERKHESEKIS